jgi:hypothetical protein
MSPLLSIKFIIVIWVHPQVVESELLLDPFFECCALLESQRVGLSNNWYNVDNIGELLEDDNVDRFEANMSASILVLHCLRMARRLDKEETAVNTGVWDISLTLSSELFAKIGRVLVFDILDDRIPAVKSELFTN